jgi:hypothetical protein
MQVGADVDARVRPQNPGGLTRWLTRVHLGSSGQCIVSQLIIPPPSSFSARTVYPFAVFLLLAVEYGVLVLWQHVLFSRHLLVPSLDGL